MLYWLLIADYCSLAPTLLLALWDKAIETKTRKYKVDNGNNIF